MADQPSKPTDPPKRTDDEGTVQIGLSVYRSLVLDKIRAEIAAKRAALDLAKRVGAEDLDSLAYWKMGYWKMRYWKHIAVMDPLSPVASAPKPPYK
jgi:hypothetical protein